MCLFHCAINLSTFPIYSTKIESKIKDFVETTDNPFEGNEPIFLSSDSRKEQRRKGAYKSRIKVGNHPDSEVQAEIDKGNTVNFIKK